MFQEGLGILAEPIHTLAEAIDYLNPFSENFFLRIAFIPTDGFIPAKFNELKEVIDDRLPIVGDLSEVFGTIIEPYPDSDGKIITMNTEANGVDSTRPKFTIDLPEKWGGQKVEIINFDIIDPYVPYIKTFIRISIWIPFLIKIYRRLPQIIY